MGNNSSDRNCLIIKDYTNQMNMFKLGTLKIWGILDLEIGNLEYIHLFCISWCIKLEKILLIIFKLS